MQQIATGIIALWHLDAYNHDLGAGLAGLVQQQPGVHTIHLRNACWRQQQEGVFGACCRGWAGSLTTTGWAGSCPLPSTLDMP